ncbi:MAG: CGNR zinc finger domain-containing protein [Actinobacteria bacterium]|nr:CGNR zinc finger domain-containing protein [Actinomycetota bacterium]
MDKVNPELQLVCDFVNTVDLEDGGDELADAAGLGRWLRTRGLWNGRPTTEDAVFAREAREALRELMRANNECDAGRERATEILDTVAARTGITVRFDGGALRVVAPSGGIGSVVAAAGQAMADGSWPRLKACRADSCRWAFVDQAKNHSRIWCSMESCGNREKARAYRRRHGAAGA